MHHLDSSCCCSNSSYYISAYGLAVKRGFVGTMDEWLKSLQAHVHVKYADKMPTSDSDMSDQPGDWLGISSNNSEEASERYTDYSWSYIKGATSTEGMADGYREKPYLIGDIVCYEGEIWRCIEAIPAGEPFNPNHWEKTNLVRALQMTAAQTAVSYEAQSLTTAQQAQARANINAVSNANGAVTTVKLADGAVTSVKIANHAVGADQLGENSVNAYHIAAGGVGNEEIYDGAVTAGKIANANVTTEKLAGSAVTTAKIADGSITTAKLAASAVNGSKMNLQNNDLPWAKLTYGVHYFNKNDSLPAATAGRIIFVKR